MIYKLLNTMNTFSDIKALKVRNLLGIRNNSNFNKFRVCQITKYNNYMKKNYESNNSFIHRKNLRVNVRFARINSENFCDGVAHMLVVANVLSTIFDTINITGPILILAIILNDKDSNGHLLLHTWGTSYFIAKLESDEIRPKLHTLYGNSIDQYSFDVEAYSIMDYAERYAFYFNAKKITTFHVLLAVSRYKNGGAYRVLKNSTPMFEELEKIMDKIRPNIIIRRDPKGFIYKVTKTDLPDIYAESEDIIESFGSDLTEKAAFEEIDPVVGREKEIERIIRVLARKSKNTPCLVGEPGVGKTAIAEGLAVKIHDNEVPRFLQNKRIVNIEVSKIVAGSRYRGDFESRLLQVVEMAKIEDDVILFIDEIHTVMGAGSAEGTLDAANMLKPPLSRGEIKVIGATTLDEFRKFIKADGALERRFQAVRVPEPSLEETVRILRGIRKIFAPYHKVVYTDEALEACAKYAKQYINDKFLPDKAIDLMDESGALVKMKIPDDKTEEEANDIRQLLKAHQETVNSIKSKKVTGN